MDIDVADENDFCKAVRTDATDSLTNDEVYDYLANVEKYREFINHSVHPPVKPNGGSVFIFDLGPNEEEWEERKKKLRYDGTISIFIAI